MKLIIAIIHDEDAGRIVDVLTDADYRVTRIATSGGFFRKSNATLLIGTEAEQVDAVLDLIRQNSRPRKPTPRGESVARATVFVIDVTQFERL
jgi:uncharacterized protein YaaQ